MTAANIQASLHIVTDGEQAIRFFEDVNGDAAAACPALVILDINLPRRHGGEVLQHMRASSKCGHVLVIAVSTSDSSRDREQMEQLGANAYFRKPSSYNDFMKLGDIAKELLRGGSVLA
jgi:two-component system, chemotaxis family, response regulator Rcp1